MSDCLRIKLGILCLLLSPFPVPILTKILALLFRPKHV